MGDRTGPLVGVGARPQPGADGERALPLVSVVVPMFDAQAWVEATLESVLAQTYPADRIETIVVDDGSSDDSVAVARAFIARRGMRARVIAGDGNHGVSAARNVGWRAARGEWIQFLDADDLLAPDKIALQAALIPRLADDVSVICASWQRLARQDGEWRPCGEVTRPQLDGSVFLRVVTIKAGFLGPALIRRRSLEAVGGLSETVTHAEDSHLMLKLAEAGGRFVEMSTAGPMFFIRQTPGSLSRRSWGKVALQYMANLAIAERLLRNASGALSEADRRELGRLSGWAMSELYTGDRASFEHYRRWLHERGLALVLEHSSRLRMLSRMLGPEAALRIAGWYRWMRGVIYARLALVSVHPAVDPSMQVCGTH